jgi:hypothetical protein
MGVTCSTHGRGDKYRPNLAVGKSKGKRIFGRARSRWENNTEMDFMEIVCESVDWVQLIQDESSVAGYFITI